MAKKAGGKKKILFPFVILLIGAAYVALALTQPLLSIHGQVTYATTTKQASSTALDWPTYGQAAVGAPGYGVLATEGEQKPISTASIAKVLTAMAVLRQQPLKIGEQGPEIVINQADVDNYKSFVAGDGSVVGVALGERITEYQALQALLLPSSNNMAVTLANWAFGSVEAYNKYVNEYAKQLGLTSIKMTDPSGYAVETVASARDLTLIASLAMLNPVFAEIVAQPSATIPVEGTIRNYNFLLGENGNIGIKTGNNDGNKGAFLFANKQTIDGREITVVGAVLGAPDLLTALRDSDALALSALKQFSSTTFIKAGQKVGTYTVPGQGAVDAIAAADLAFPTWSDRSYRSSVTLQPLTGATSASSKVGTFTVIDTTSNASTNIPIKLAAPTKQPGILWRLKHPLGT